jgi:hypothetical protein
MHPHSSISAAPAKVEALAPVETMPPYDPCWCRSGKKYKWCHFRREEQPRLNIFEVEQQMLAELRNGYCSFPPTAQDPCSATIARAHTIQRRGGLSLIAEDHHVLTVKPTMKMMLETEGQPEPRRISTTAASVFPGFCSKHDTSLFKPIEGKTLTLTKENAFLLAYRAIAYERFAKEAQMRSLELQRRMDQGHPFWKQELIQGQMHILQGGVVIGMRDVEAWKAQFDERLISGDRDDFHFVAVRFDAVLPFVAASAFHAEFDLAGERLQRLGRGDIAFEHMSVNVTAFAGETVLVMGWIGTGDGPAARLAQSFLDVPNGEKAAALLQMLFVQSDNIFLRPSWWAGLPDDIRSIFLAHIRSGTTLRERIAEDLILSVTALISASPIETKRG